MPPSLGLHGILYCFQLWMETITEWLLPDELHSARSHTDMQTSTYTRLRTPSQTSRPALNHSVKIKDTLLPLERETRVGGRERSSGGSLLLFHSLPLSLCTEETSLLSPRLPVSTALLVLPLHTMTIEQRFISQGNAAFRV